MARKKTLKQQLEGTENLLNFYVKRNIEHNRHIRWFRGALRRTWRIVWLNSIFYFTIGLVWGLIIGSLF